MIDDGLIKNERGTEVVVLGAGFSKAVSECFPLTDDLGERAAEFAGLKPKTRFSEGLFEAWLSRLSEPQPYLSQAENTSNRAYFERLVQSIHAVLSEIERRVVADGLPAWLLRLVAALHCRRATVITFNYDALIERALMQLGFHDFEVLEGDHAVRWPDVFGGVPSFPPIPARWSGGLKPTLHLLKLHGSLNWHWVPGDFSGATLHHWDHDDDDGRSRYLPGREPFLVPPAATKSAFFRNPIVGETWKRAAGSLRATKELALVGYSMPPTDLVAAGMFAEAVGREGVVVTVVNPSPDPVVSSFQRLTGLRASTVASVEEFAASYVESASRALAQQLTRDGAVAPVDALLLAGWNRDLLARVIDVRREGLALVLEIGEFGDPAPHSPAVNGSAGAPARKLSELVREIRVGDTLLARFANGRTTTLVGIDRMRMASGASEHWQVLLPADAPGEFGVVRP